MVEGVKKVLFSIKNWMGPYQRNPKEFARAIRYSGWGVRSVGPVADFLDIYISFQILDEALFLIYQVKANNLRQIKGKLLSLYF